MSGQPVGDDLRSLVITLILEAGGNIENEFIPRGVLSRVASQLKLSKTCVKNIWSRYCETGSVKPKPHGGGIDSKLKEQDLLYIEQLKREKPSIYLHEIQEKLARFSNVDVSTSTICSTLKRKLKDGPWTRKVMITPYAERFTPNNMQYTQAFLNYVSRLVFLINLNSLMKVVLICRTRSVGNTDMHQWEHLLLRYLRRADRLTSL